VQVRAEVIEIENVDGREKARQEKGEFHWGINPRVCGGA
jgi:hypothetical protein